MLLKKMLFALLVFIGLISSCGKPAGHLTHVEMEEVKKLPADKKLKELSAEDAEIALRHMRKSLQAVVNDDAAKATAILQQAETDEDIRAINEDVIKTKALIDNDVHFKRTLDNTVPRDLVEACVYADISFKAIIANKDRIKAKAQNKDAAAINQIADELTVTVKADTMKELQITEDRFEKVKACFVEITKALAKGIESN